jgi:uncharacterized protein
MDDWRDNLVTGDDGLRRVLKDARRIAVLGIKPESRADRPAYYVPAYLQEVGYEIVPVPVYYPDVTEILGQPVHRDLGNLPGPIDLVDVFRRPEDIPPHVPDMLALKPKYVWFQLGIRNDEAARRLAEAGIEVVQDRCMLAEHRRLFG